MTKVAPSVLWWHRHRPCASGPRAMLLQLWDPAHRCRAPVATRPNHNTLIPYPFVRGAWLRFSVMSWQCQRTWSNAFAILGCRPLVCAPALCVALPDLGADRGYPQLCQGVAYGLEALSHLRDAVPLCLAQVAVACVSPLWLWSHGISVMWWRCQRTQSSLHWDAVHIVLCRDTGDQWPPPPPGTP